MKELVVFYSYGGVTKRVAQELAKRQGADICEVKDVKRPNIVGAFLRCPSARKMKKTPALPLSADMNAYEKIYVLAPVWAGFPAPAINNVFDALPGGKAVEVHLVSGSGKSACHERVEQKICAQGCTLDKFEDIKPA